MPRYAKILAIITRCPREFFVCFGSKTEFLLERVAEKLHVREIAAFVIFEYPREHLDVEECALFRIRSVASSGAHTMSRSLTIQIGESYLLSSSLKYSEGMELIFEIRDADESGYYARALGYAIFTEAETWE